MAIFGGKRDLSFFRHINRELMGNIISTQASFYKYKIKETPVNIYGEASKEKFYIGPIIFNCIVEREDQDFPNDERGTSFNWNINFKFLRDDLRDANLYPERGDIIMYNDSYFEVDTTNEDQLVWGKNDEFANEINPLNPGLGNFGQNWSIICKTHIIPSDKVNITKERI